MEFPETTTIKVEAAFHMVRRLSSSDIVIPASSWAIDTSGQDLLLMNCLYLISGLLSLQLSLLKGIATLLVQHSYSQICYFASTFLGWFPSSFIVYSLI